MLTCAKIESFQVRTELDDLRDKLQPLQMKYRKEKLRIDEIRTLKQRREELQFTLQEAERRMDLARVADLRYGALLEVDAAIAKLEGETGENLMLTETVGPEQIAEVCFAYKQYYYDFLRFWYVGYCFETTLHTGREPLDGHSCY